MTTFSILVANNKETKTRSSQDLEPFRPAEMTRVKNETTARALTVKVWGTAAPEVGCDPQMIKNVPIVKDRTSE